MTLRAGHRIMRASARVAAPAGTGGPSWRDRAARLAHLLPAGPAMTEAASGVPGAGEQKKSGGVARRGPCRAEQAPPPSGAKEGEESHAMKRVPVITPLSFVYRNH